jgi:hypothetical protein
MLIAEVMRGHMRRWRFVRLIGKRPVVLNWQKTDDTIDTLLAWIRGGDNVGLRTGAASGVAVVDIEHESPVRPIDFPATVIAVTGGGGWHLYYRMPTGTERIGNRSRTMLNRDGEKLDGVDLRADEGQVVFVGSIHPATHAPYRWMRGRGPEDVQMASLPMWLLATPPVSRTARDEQDRPAIRLEHRAMAYLETLPPAISGSGGHNATFLAACTCWRFGLAEGEVARCMEWFNANRARPAWSEKELAHKIRSARLTVERSGEIGRIAREKQA